MVRILKSSRGYTLAEALVTVAIVSTLAATTAPVMVNITNFWRQATARNDVQKDAATALDTINRFLRQAKSSTIIIDEVSGQPPFSRLTFQDAANQTIQFYQSGSKLYMTLNSQQSLLTQNIGYIAFTFPRTDDNTIMSVAVTMQKATYLGSSKALQLSIQKVRIMNP